MPQVTTVCYASSFVPPEWIAAHGLRPWRIIPEDHTVSEERIRVPEREGLCPYAADIAARAEHRNAITVFATTCDQMRRLAESTTLDQIPSFLLHVPATWHSNASAAYYESELVRLGRYLESMGGRKPSQHDLITNMERFEAGRTQLRARRAQCSAREYLALVNQFYQTGICPTLPETTKPTKRGIPLMLLGSPLRQADLDILDQIELAGAHIAVDGTDTGEREWPRLFPPRQMRENPLRELSQAYFEIPAVFRRPNQAFYQWLQQDAFMPPHLQGIVFITHPWCDLWRAELPRLQDAVSLPILHLSLGGSIASHESRATRIEAFLEMIA